MKDSIWERFSAAAMRDLEKTAIFCDDQRISYGLLYQTCLDYCGFFRRQGICTSMHVGLWVEKSPAFAAALFALLRTGAVVVPINTSSTTEAIEIAAEAADLQRIVYSRKMSEKAALLSETTRQKLLCLEDLPPSESADPGAASVCDESLFLMTSGSTGKPKIAVISQAAMLYRLDLEALRFSLQAEDRVLISTPIYHSLGIRFLMTALTLGITIVLPKAFQAGQWLRLIRRHQITYTITVPTQIVEILAVAGKDPRQAKEMLQSLRYILSTSAYLPETVKRNFLPLISGTFINFIASSETEYIALADCRWEDPKGDLLGEPFPSVEILILQNDIPVAAGTIGEIVCKSPQLFSAYYGDPRLTEGVFWNGYYRTGDLGVFDASGRLHYAGRKKNTIICGGVNIFPKDIERVVAQLPQVKECAAFGIPHPKYGEVPALAAAGDELSVEIVKRHCIKSLAPYQQPRKIVILDKLPRGEVGKVNLELLKKTCS